jgi:predicted chitinase
MEYMSKLNKKRWANRVLLFFWVWKNCHTYGGKGAHIYPIGKAVRLKI